MSSISKIPLSMVKASGDVDADVRFTGDEVVVTREGDERRLGSGLSKAVFDDATGVLTLTLIDGTNVKIPGFLTKAALGTGTPGPQGPKGVDGADGASGQKGESGAEGCAGPAGPPGTPGQRGPMGDVGDKGDRGDQGPVGPRGIPGVIQTYIQRDDPGPVGAGAIWVKA